MHLRNAKSFPTAIFQFSLHVLLTCMICVRPTIFIFALGNDTDRVALLYFRESIDYDPRGILSSWKDSMNFCNWPGVTCSRQHQRVTALNLEGYELRGTITPHVGNLTFLRYINLRNNSFHGYVPQEIGRLYRLQHLNLTNNLLGGPIPVSLSNCTELRVIEFTNNRLVGQIPTVLGSLAKLQVLNSGSNNLTGVIPASFGNLSSIERLSVAYNKLVGNIPHGIGNLRSLSVFSTTSNNLSGIVPSSIFNMSSLTILSISVNYFSGIIPPDIGRTLPNIQILGLGTNEFSGTIPQSLPNASRLEIFDVVYNNLEGHVPSNLGSLQNLFWLGLGNNRLGRNSTEDLGFLTNLANSSSLQILDLSDNQLGGLLPKSVVNFSSELSELYFGNNQIYGPIPEDIGNLVNLIVIGMEFNRFSGSIPSSIGKLQKLQGLGLGPNQLTGSIPSSIGNLTQLFQLYLLRNRLQGSIPFEISKCQNLQLLDISHNDLNGTIPPQVISISKLTTLANFSYNSFTGRLPVEVGKLTSLNALDVSENHLSGEIPEAIGECESLEILNLQGNSFQDIIPSSLVSLKGLRHLDLSRNNLSGQIPHDLQNLPFLVYLNLSFNSLEGDLPVRGVFRNLTAISVSGNTELCGGVAELRLPPCPVKVQKKGRSHHFILKVTIIVLSVVVFVVTLLFFIVFYVKRQLKRKSTLATDELPSNVTYQKLFQATGGFATSNLIGSGSFGSVYKGILVQEDKVVAVKVLNLQKKGASKSFTAECNVLRNVRHRNLVKVITCCSSLDFGGREFKALVFYFMENGCLEKWLHPNTGNESQSGTLSLLQRLNIAIDVASALHYLHDLCDTRIVHCDLKPSNILLDNDMVAHVSDFGLARVLFYNEKEFLQSLTSTIGLKGSIGYAAPEYGTGGKASPQGDVYSFGVLILEMFTGKRPTDDMFTDGLNIHNHVKKSLPDRLVQIVDLTMLQPQSTNTGEEDSNNDVEGKATTSEKPIQIDEIVHDCLLSVLTIGLACSMESPRERMTIRNIIDELLCIKNALLREDNSDH